MSNTGVRTVRTTPPPPSSQAEIGFGFRVLAIERGDSIDCIELVQESGRGFGIR
jgi:hypothetical protein